LEQEHEDVKLYENALERFQRIRDEIDNFREDIEKMENKEKMSLSQ